MPNRLKLALALCGAVAMLAGCGGTAATPSGARASFPDKSASWMVPQAKTTSLLYVSNAGTQDVTVYTYLDGNGLVLVGTLTGFSFPTGMCTDSAGDVWIPDYDTGKIEEFAHGGTTQIFTITQRVGHPYDCAVNPNNGSLAVANQQPGNKHGLNGSVVVYGKGSHQGSSYQPQKGFSELDFLAYDNRNNLFADGAENDFGNGLFKLSKNATQFSPLTIAGGTLHQPGAVNWIKPTLLVGDGNVNGGTTPGAYKIFVSGSTATIVASLNFTGTQQTYGFWRRAGRVIVPDHLGNLVRIYNLSDGTLVNHFGDDVSLPFGAVVSQ